jgi:hypothetical protein
VPEDHPAAKALLTMMEEISEAHYCAGWMSGLEYSLWRIVQGGDRNYGMYPLEPAEVESLRWLAESCDGWWIWHDAKTPSESGEKFVTMAEWLPIYERNEASRV